jgi:hypothetical protein
MLNNLLTLKNLTLLNMQTELIFSQEDSLVNHTQVQGSDLEKKMTATSGRKCSERLKKFNHVGLWAKTFTDLLIGQEGWFSTKCRLTWRLKGTKYSRIYCQLYPSTHPIEGIESGLLPTPSVADTEGSPKRIDQISQGQNGTFYRTSDNTGTRFGAKLNDVARLLPTPTAMIGDAYADKSPNSHLRHTQNIATLAAKGMLPTPNTRDWKDSIGNGIDAPSIGKTRGYSLGQKINSMLPTPAASDWKGAYRPESMTNKDGTFNREERLVNIYLKTGQEYNSKTSQLSPHFVMEMMGFPTDWTLLPFLSGEQNP